ncbi:hypothetical protein [uncultured Clostridium sp.]|uniref:hypothetical protein n=1 Tax=uncultured Clostridium sp. TaxID=59620 RepID=UPI0025FC02C2|nr:hypothetical protein [uncultured Clostridium sp.]
MNIKNSLKNKVYRYTLELDTYNCEKHQRVIDVISEYQKKNGGSIKSAIIDLLLQAGEMYDLYPKSIIRKSSSPEKFTYIEESEIPRIKAPEQKKSEDTVVEETISNEESTENNIMSEKDKLKAILRGEYQ